jgi:archaellum component FlaG (FlaF/FlaG flagellin family)
MGSPVPPAPAPGNGAVPPLPPGFIPTKPKNPLKPLYIIGGVIGGLLLISFVIFGVSDFQAQLANVKKTSPSSSPGLSLSGTQIKVALGKSANIDGLEMKVEKITENYQGETSKLYPGNAENYVHVVYSVKNTTSSSLTLSEINVQSVVNGRVMIPDYNPEPSDLSKDATIQPGATATYSMNILLTTSDSLSNAKFAYQLQKKIYIFDLN